MADETGHDDQGRVIVIGWQPIAVSLLGIAVLAVGFIAGRAMSNRRTAAAGPQASGSQASAAVPSAAGQGLVVPGASGGDVLPPSFFDESPGSSQALDLPVPAHPLLYHPAPDFTMPRLGTEESVTLRDLAGKPIMINFWATWCPPCRHEMPWIQAVYDAYRDQGLEVLAVNAGEKVSQDRAAATVSAFVEMMALTFPVLFGDLDSSIEVQRAYSVAGLPATYFVDPSGTVVDLHTGMFPNGATLELKVRRLLGLAGTASPP